MSDNPYAPRALRIGDHPVGAGQPCFIIAEAGINHNGNVEMALQLVDLAADAGADAVKFQKRHLPSLYPAALLDDSNLAEWSFQYLLPILEQCELSDEEFHRIADHCRDRGIRFMCTPWDSSSLEFLETLGIEAYKVASADLVNLPLLDSIAHTDKPLILSTGMSTLEEIERTAAHLSERGASFALLHCVSTYPAPFEGLSLRFIETLKRFGVPVGYSSHERGIAMPVAAITLGASIVEKHITLDRTLPGPDHPASLEPAGIHKLVRDIRHLEAALGAHEKELSAMELQNQLVFRKSLAAARRLEAGTVVTPEMVTTMGPGKGLSPQRLDDLIGVTLRRDLDQGEYFTEADLAAAGPDTLMSDTLKRPWGLKARFHDLDEVLAMRPDLVELHFSDDDLQHAFDPPPQPHPQQLVIHAPEFTEQRLVDLCSEDDEWRETSIDLMQRTIDRAAELGQHFSGQVQVVMHVGGMSINEPVTDLDPLIARAVDSFRRFRTHGVVLLPENLPPRPWYLGGQWYQNLFTHPEHMIEFCRELDVDMALDVSHAQLLCAASGRDLGEYVSLCLPYSRHLHLADAAGIDREGLQIGEGVIDWEQLLALLSDKDFTWVPEIWSGHLHNHAGFVRAVNRLAAYGRL